ENSDRPARENEIGEKRRERQTKRPEIEAEERNRKQRNGNHRDQQAHAAHHHQREQEFGGPQRRHHDVAEVARVHFLEKQNEKTDLAAKKKITREHRADEDAAGLREKSGILRNVDLQDPPHQHLHRRPVNQVEDA